MKKIFLICSVRNASQELLDAQLTYVTACEKMGYRVHYPPRDTNQNMCGLDICETNKNAIKNSDEVHIFYNHESQGTHFDMGVAFAFNKPIVIVSNDEFGEGKSFPRMLSEWAKSQ